MFTLAYQIAQEQHVEWKLLMPLIEETIRKIRNMSPVEAQTGPALRNDTKLMEKHLSLLNNEYARQIYQLVSESIRHSLLSKDENNISVQH